MSQKLWHDCHLVSVVIPTVGRETLHLCQNALEKQTRVPNEVIIVRDLRRRGASWARNEGIRQAQGDLIAFLDDDCVPSENWLEYLILTIDKYDADGVGGTYQEVDPLLHAARLRRKIPEIEQLDNLGLVGAGGECDV